MKRDMDLVRKILLAVENDQANSTIDGYDDITTRYHKALVIEAGLVHGAVLKGGMDRCDIPSEVRLEKLTWAGHDFVDGIAKDSNWEKVKSFLLESGKQITIETVKTAITRLFGFGT